MLNHKFSILNPMFGDRLKLARERSGLTMAELSRKAGGISGSAISQLEAGTSKGARPENLAALARALGVDMYWLATGEPNPVQISESTSDSNASSASASTIMLAEMIELFMAVDGTENKRLLLEAARGFVSR